MTIKNDAFSLVDKNDDAIQFLTGASRTSEWLWSIYFKYVIATVISMAWMSISSVFLCWLIGRDLNVHHFYHPLKVV